MQKCTKCGEDKEDSSFYWKLESENKRTCICISCMKEYQQKWYSKNAEIQKGKIISRRHTIRDFLNKIKEESQCEICGETESCCLQFHHKNSPQKEIDLAKVASRGWSIEHIQKELEKCMVLCANCHFKVHARKT